MHQDWMLQGDHCIIILMSYDRTRRREKKLDYHSAYITTQGQEIKSHESLRTHFSISRSVCGLLQLQRADIYLNSKNQAVQL